MPITIQIFRMPRLQRFELKVVELAWNPASVAKVATYYPRKSSIVDFRLICNRIGCPLILREISKLFKALRRFTFETDVPNEESMYTDREQMTSYIHRALEPHKNTLTEITILGTNANSFTSGAPFSFSHYTSLKKMAVPEGLLSVEGHYNGHDVDDLDERPPACLEELQVQFPIAEGLLWCRGFTHGLCEGKHDKFPTLKVVVYWFPHYKSVHENRDDREVLQETKARFTVVEVASEWGFTKGFNSTPFGKWNVPALSSFNREKREKIETW